MQFHYREVFGQHVFCDDDHELLVDLPLLVDSIADEFGEHGGNTAGVSQGAS